MTFSFQGKTVYYDVLGKGSPILFVHGWGGSSESLRKLATLLSEKYQCVIVDLPGFGKSDFPPPGWGVAEYAEMLEKLLDELKIKKTDYFGHSFGGSLGVYLSANTSRIDHLILCNSSYKRTNRKSKLVFLKNFIPFFSQFRLLLYKIFFPKSDLAKYPQLEANFRKIVTTDLLPLLEKIKVPTLILWGENDTITPVSLAYELHDKIKDSKLVIIPDTRHALPLRNPELLVKPIEEFI